MKATRAAGGDSRDPRDARRRSERRSKRANWRSMCCASRRRANSPRCPRRRWSTRPRRTSRPTAATSRPRCRATFACSNAATSASPATKVEPGALSLPAEAVRRVRSAEGPHRGRPPRGAREVAHVAGQPADLARDGESRVAVALRRGPGRHAERLRQDGPASRRTRNCSTGSRANCRPRPAGRGRLNQAPPPPDRHERDLQAIVHLAARRREGRRGQPPSVAAEPHAARRGAGARRDPRRQRPARSHDAAARRTCSST